LLFQFLSHSSPADLFCYGEPESISGEREPSLLCHTVKTIERILLGFSWGAGSVETKMDQ